MSPCSSPQLKPLSLSHLLLSSFTASGLTSPAYHYAKSLAPPPSVPPPHYCEVTGLPGSYKDPKTGMRLGNLEAVEMVREKVPPWVSNVAGGGCEWFQAVGEIRERGAEMEAGGLR